MKTNLQAAQQLGFVSAHIRKLHTPSAPCHGTAVPVEIHENPLYPDADIYTRRETQEAIISLLIARSVQPAGWSVTAY